MKIFTNKRYREIINNYEDYEENKDSNGLMKKFRIMIQG